MCDTFLKKYQPQHLKDFILEKEYIEILKTLIQMDNLNIILIGNSGSGKTSLLNAIIKDYYGTSKDFDRSNILEINNLEEQGIQYYRTCVKTFCQTSSSIHGKKKFIVIDDIDHINTQSQQVFRNCIDKYCHNIHFISTCTNTQKVIESLQSRLITIKIKPVFKNLLHKILIKIKKQEKMNINNETCDFIINISNNSIRILINYMEKLKLLNEPITLKLVKEVCTNISFYEFDIYTKLWFKEKNLQKAIECIFSIYNKGYSVIDILDNYFFFIKITPMIDSTDKYHVTKIICKYITFFYNLHECKNELAFFTNELIYSLQK